jgi:hypothetical protein
MPTPRRYPQELPERAVTEARKPNENTPTHLPMSVFP